MKSVRIIALRQDRKRLLEHLQDSGLVQIEKTETCRKGFGKIDMTSQIQIFERNVTLSENALKILDSNSPEKKSMLSAFADGGRLIPMKSESSHQMQAKLLMCATEFVSLTNRLPIMRRNGFA